MKEIGVLGAGSWGTALAVHLARVGHGVRLWAREPEVVEDMKSRRENTAFLAGIQVPDSVRPCNRFDEALEGVDLVLRRDAVARHARGAPRGGSVGASCRHHRQRDEGSRGRHAASRFRGHRQELGPDRPVVALSGPSFAREVAAGLPTAVCAASASQAAAELVQSEFRGRLFRLYTTSDVVGVEIGAALKNVIAIAAGVVEGLGLGHNALAGLITRGLAEISRLASALGGRRETLAGLTGLGDLVLDLHRQPQPQPPGRHRAGPRPDARRDPRRDEDGRRGRPDDGRRAGARRARRRRAAHRRADGRGARGTQAPAARRPRS